MSNSVTIFKNVSVIDTPFHREVEIILDRIKTGKSKELVKRIRLEKRKTERNELKKQLPAICFSGTFSKRTDASLIEHSGLICLDFDEYPKQKDMLQDKEMLSKDPFVYSVFVSPSGNGLKVLVRIPPDAENHVNYFNSLSRHFNNPHFDKTSKNVSRVCYESYDPLIYVNPNSSIWDVIEEPEYVEVNRNIDPVTIPITDENKIVEILIKWWERKFPFEEGQRNQNVYILAMAFNDFGVNKSLAGYMLERYASSDFPKSEIMATIDSAYRNSEKFGSKYYEDEERVNAIRIKMKRGIAKKEIRSQLIESNLESELVDSVLARIEDEGDTHTFWTKSEKGVIKIVHILFKKFLENSGFYKYYPERSSNYVFVRVTNNLMNHTSEKEIKDFVLNYVLALDDITIYNYFADNVRFFRDEFLSMLDTIDVFFISDTKDTAYLYYNNCAVKVTKEDITTIDYLDLGGYVWKDQVINRNFDKCKVTAECHYKRFIANISGGDIERVKSFESTIGFLMHGYKNLGYCPAVILNDEVISDNPEGGTGKGIFMNAIGQMKKLVVIDGKTFLFEKSFAYQLVSVDTQVICFDDAKKHFDFERLFSLISEGITLEKKNKDAIKIPFSKSAKIAITTNYAIKGAGTSFTRRKWELELSQHYNMEWTPLDEFGKMLFGDWNEGEWCEFDNYMIGCLKKYLSTGLVRSKFVNLSIRQLSAETCHEFVEWCGLLDEADTNSELVVGVKLNKQDLYSKFIEEYPDYGPKSRLTISRNRFYKWLTSYAVFKTGIMAEEGRDPTGRWIKIRTRGTQKDLPFNEIKEEPEQEEETWP